ncbi:hypothetical protein [Paraburkholderia hospita]|nr:hypothetical protein [Paraburkholderia hospita]
MPTILDINPGTLPRTDLRLAASYLTKARREPLQHDDLAALKRLVNNSMVGASKLLHFVAPQRHAVWDSKVFAFCFDRYGYNYEVNNVRNYESYLSALKELMTDRRFDSFHAAVCSKVGYPVSGLRALELVMFLNAPDRRRNGRADGAEEPALVRYG